MGFYNFCIILICFVCLILNAFIVEAEDIKLSTTYSSSPCPSNSSVDLSRSITTASTNMPDNIRKCVTANPYDKFWIQCKPESSLPSNLTVAWYKASKDKEDLGKLVERSSVITFSGEYNDKIEFSSVAPDDTGVYHCRVVTKGQEANQKSAFQASQLIEVEVLPWVKSVQKDVTAIEENSFSLTCVVSSSVPATVIWNISNLVANETYTQSRDRVILSSGNSTKNSVLLIKSANISIDRGDYVCIAESSYGKSSSNMTFHVRIKSKYAALWPFLGICAEVIILCTIILIYEKRDKTELEESDTDQGPETKSSPDHGQDSVRYRK